MSKTVSLSFLQKISKTTLKIMKKILINQEWEGNDSMEEFYNESSDDSYFVKSSEDMEI